MSLVGWLALLGGAACAGTEAEPEAPIGSGADADAVVANDAPGDAIGEATSDAIADAPGDATSDAIGDAPGDADARPPRPAPTAACLALKAGWNTGFWVGSVARSFYLDLPSGAPTGGPWPVVFAWHGMTELPGPMRELMRGEIDGPAYKFILVTPDDVNLALPFGADWDNLDLRDGSLEADLFDAVLTCLDARFGVDADRVHSVGFSSGAITSDMLGVLRGDRIASLVTFSGAYWSNTANGNTFAYWPPLTTPNRYVQLMMYGGATDTAFGVNFMLVSSNDVPYLNKAGHDVIVCDHGGGHALPKSFGGASIAAFLRAHSRGVTTSPYAASLPPGYPTLCAYRPR